MLVSSDALSCLCGIQTSLLNIEEIYLRNNTPQSCHSDLLSNHPQFCAVNPCIYYRIANAQSSIIEVLVFLLSVCCYNPVILASFLYSRFVSCQHHANDVLVTPCISQVKTPAHFPCPEGGGQIMESSRMTRPTTIMFSHYCHLKEIKGSVKSKSVHQHKL